MLRKLFSRGFASLVVALLACSGLNGMAATLAQSDTTATLAEFRPGPGNSSTYLRIGIRYPGVYRITGQACAEAGMPISQVSIHNLQLWHEGSPVPLHLGNSSAGQFGAADWLEFVGDAPSHPENTMNVYYLTWHEPARSRFQQRAAAPPPPASASATFLDHRVLERDLKRLQMKEVPPGVTDSFFWAHVKVGVTDTNIYFGFPGYDRASDIPVSVTLRLFGASDVQAVRPSHKFTAMLGDLPLGNVEFDGFRYFDLSTTVTLPKTITRREPLRFVAPPERSHLVDAIAVDEVEIAYPRKLDAEGRDLFRFNSNIVRWENAGADEIPVQGLPPGSRIFALEEGSVYTSDDPAATRLTLPAPDSPTTYVVSSAKGFYSPTELSYVEKNSSKDLPSDTEALLLYHPRLTKSAQFLSAYRNQSGLKTAAVDVLQVFDALNHGFLDDVAMKRYIRHAKERCPSLNYLILFGDGTADYRQTNYEKVEVEPVWNLIPVHWVENPAVNQGGYFDDTWYGCFTPTSTPDLAIGRIPANTEEEAARYLRKLVEYEQLKLGATGKFLLLSSVEKSFQDLIVQAKEKHQSGFTTSTVLFPETEKADKEVERLRDAWNDNTNLLYYLGHGGAFVWRVGPTDYQRQKDLFTPKEVDRLQNKGRYPVVICSSCYTTSFELYYSLGEALLFGPEKGAIAVVGTPWKSTVYEDHHFNMDFLDAYVKPSTTRLGEAFLYAKQAGRRAGHGGAVDFQSFTLLGDPTMALVRK